MKQNRDLKNLIKIENEIFNMKQTQCYQNGKHCQFPAVQLTINLLVFFFDFPPGINN